MIVYSYDEAKPIVLEQIASGKKIGQWTIGGSLHDGYKSCANELKKYCDYSICYYSTASVQNNWSLFWSDNKNLDFINKNKVLDINVAHDAEQYSDLVIMGTYPSVPDDQDIQTEIKNITLERFINPYSNIVGKSILNDKNYFYETGVFSSLYYLNKYYFKNDVRVRSYKDGLWRFLHEKLFPSIGTIQITIPPVRNSDGLCYGNSNIGLDSLALVSNGKPLIISKDETKESLQERLLESGWNVGSFKKYSGELLSNHLSEGDTYISIILVDNNDNTHQYGDGFIL